jgi:NAD(P)-dependent dehydrogenase (short-subunit alcohol dehydrogenase family)
LSPSTASGAGRTILITGCSSGIGADAAATLKARGWRVFASCRKTEDCARLQAAGFEVEVFAAEDLETDALARRRLGIDGERTGFVHFVRKPAD